MKKVYLALKALIIKNGKILIIKRTSKEDCFKGQWDIPGGGIKFGEDPIEGLKREVKEEAGIDICVIKPIRIWTFFQKQRQNSGYWYNHAM